MCTRGRDLEGHLRLLPTTVRLNKSKCNHLGLPLQPVEGLLMLLISDTYGNCEASRLAGAANADAFRAEQTACIA